MRSDMLIAVALTAIVSSFPRSPAWAVPHVQTPSPTASSPSSNAESVKPSEALKRLVAAYLREPAAQARSEMLRHIETASGQDVSAVAEALRSAKLWTRPDSLAGELATPDSGPVRALAYLLPDGYDPDRRYPLLVFWSPSPDALGALQTLRVKTGDTLKGFVCVCPLIDADYEDAWKAERPLDLSALVRAVRTRLHVDSDRVFLIGDKDGASMAWSMALGQPDILAGALFVASAPPLPYPAQSYPLLLPNLRGLDVLLVWGASDRARGASSWVGSYCDAVLAFAQERSLRISGIKLETTRNPWDSFDLWGDRFAAFLACGRKPMPRVLTHWFRYPHQGGGAWLRQSQFIGAPWMAPEQLSIRRNPGPNAEGFVRNVLESKLGLIEGRFDGTTLAMETRRCGQIELRWPLSWLHASLPVKVTVNGKVRRVGDLTPCVGALLESARETWDFQRLFVARVSFSIKAEPSRTRQRHPTR